MAGNQMAIEAARRRLNGRPSREVGREKIERALVWIHRWGWSWPTMIDYIAGGGRRGLAARLAKLKLVDRHETPSGGTDGLPSVILTATPDGVAIAEANIDDPVPYQANIPWRTLRHDAALQILTATAIFNPDHLNRIRLLGDHSDWGLEMLDPPLPEPSARHSLIEYVTERELRHRVACAQQDGQTQAERIAAGSAKVHDIIWYIEDGEGCERTLAIELELTHKKSQEFSRTVVGLARQILDPDSEVDEVRIVAGTPAIQERYGDVIRGKPIQPYRRNRYRQWVQDGPVRSLSDKARERMRVIRLPLRDIRLPGA